MVYVNKDLINIANASGKYVKMEIGEKVVGKYMGYTEKMNTKFNKMSYQFQILLDGEDEAKDLSTSAAKVIRKFAYIRKGTMIEIKKLGDGQSTDYEITELDDADEDYDKPKKSKKLKSKKKKKKKASLDDL